ncbi:MAG: hypothetical protein OXI43_22360 [Candidatus Poribacteria bacterium]|nr:hypothetical protein [Candidatus Poribacteria bacterium]
MLLLKRKYYIDDRPEISDADFDARMRQLEKLEDGGRIMSRWKYLFLIVICLSFTSCTALLTKQEYVLIDQKISEKPVFYGVVYSIPERAKIYKIVLLGTGRVQNYEISVRDKKNKWKPVKQIKRAIEFPFEITLAVETDAIKISHYSVVGRGRLDTIQLYTLVEKYPTK